MAIFSKPMVIVHDFSLTPQPSGMDQVYFVGKPNDDGRRQVPLPSSHCHAFVDYILCVHYTL